MARAILNAGLFAFIKRRGYSTAAAVTGTGSKGRPAVDSNSTSNSNSSSPSSSWVPDPVTGCYRPGNWRVEIDAAEMRESLLPRAPQVSRVN